MKHPRQQGTVLIEFTLSFLIFWIVFIGILEFGRTLLVWNTAAEATRIAARMASICTSESDIQKTAIANKVVYLLKITGQATYTAPSTPTATAALASGATNWRWPMQHARCRQTAHKPAPLGA